MSRNPPPRDVSSMFTLKVDNLRYSTSGEMLKEVFEKYGEVGDVYLPRNYQTNEQRGYAFVRFLYERGMTMDKKLFFLYFS